MIQLNQFAETLAEMKATVNSDYLTTLEIKHVVISATESHMVKKLKDKDGIIVAAKMADADASIMNRDAYSEMNHMLLFILRKVDPSGVTDQKELDTYAELQEVTSAVKDWLMNKGSNGNFCDKEQEMQNKLRTEWEYNIFGGFYGLSIGFDIKDYNL